MDFIKLKEYKKISGIYGLIYENEIIYIGQSTNLEHRIKKHMKETNIREVLCQINKEKGSINRTKQLALYMFIDQHREEIDFLILKETDQLNYYE